MNILITGATGFIGSYVARDLASKGHNVFCILREGSDTTRIDSAKSSLNYVFVDYSDVDSWQSKLPVDQIDGVYHLGWNGVAGSDRNSLIQVSNIQIAAQIVKLASDLGARFFVSTGSQAEYGPKIGKLNETQSEEPTTLYGKSKLATKSICEHLCQHFDIRFCWVRVFSTYGPMDNPWWMIPSLIKAIDSGEVPPLTLGEQKWDYLHVRDAAAAISSLAFSDNACGVFNLGSGAAPTLRHTVETIRDIIDSNAKLGFGEVPYRPDQVMHLEADIAKFTSATGWQPEVSLEEGLKETVAWFTKK